MGLHFTRSSCNFSGLKNTAEQVNDFVICCREIREIQDVTVRSMGNRGNGAEAMEHTVTCNS